MRPALTKHEWEAGEYTEHEDTEGSVGFSIALPHRPTLWWNTSPLGWRRTHALAALCLHGQPFGFRHEDVLLCRGNLYHVETPEFYGALYDLADRIAALLPPGE